MNQAEIFWSISLLRSTPCWCQPFGSGEPQHGRLCVDLSSNSHLNSLFFGDASVSHMFQNHLIRVRCDLLSLRDPFGHQATSRVRDPLKNNFFYHNIIIHVKHKQFAASLPTINFLLFFLSRPDIVHFILNPEQDMRVYIWILNYWGGTRTLYLSITHSNSSNSPSLKKQDDAICRIHLIFEYSTTGAGLELFT